MSSDTLPNYIRSARKATGLTVKDLAYLLGHSSGSSVSHYEAFHRTPSLVTALALLIALNKPVDELFTGVYQEALRAVASQADALLAEDYDFRSTTTRDTARELWLQRLAGHNQTTLSL